MTRYPLGGIPACLLPAAIWLGFVTACPNAGADGGAVVLSDRAGDYQVTVLASPGALHVGAADLSVLVQDAASGQTVDGLSVTLCLTPEGSPPADTLRQAATRAAATNKLFYAAQFDLPTAGRWRLSASVRSGTAISNASREDTVTVEGQLDVAGPPPRWVELWPWIGWPAVVVLLFTLRERLVCNHRQRTGRPRPIVAGGG